MIKKYLERVSVRDFKEHELKQGEIDNIKDLINSSPTSTNSMQFSAILVNDKKKLEVVALALGQAYIAKASGFILFIGDVTRINIDKNKTYSREWIQHEFIRCIEDAAIAGGITNAGLRELGFDSTFIGNTPSGASVLEKELKLPETSILALGLAFGKANVRNGIKPKMNKVFINEYSKDDALNEYKRYNKETIDYFKSINHPSYSEQIKFMFENPEWEKRFEQLGKYWKNKLDKFK